MTEQEAEVLEAKFTQIWDAEISCQFNYLSPNECAYDFGALLVRDSLGDIELSIEEDTISLSCGITYFLITVKEAGLISTDHPPQTPEEVEFRRTWLDYFRRGCFLMGLPVEANTHEKAEWIQGFSREEIEAWNLKI